MKNISPLNLSPSLGRCDLMANQDMILSGQDIFLKYLKDLTPQLKIFWYQKEGQAVFTGQIIATVEGDLKGLLEAKDKALLLLRRTSGIASCTRLYVKTAQSTKTEIFAPINNTFLYPQAEKLAIVHGGGKISSNEWLVSQNLMDTCPTYKKAVETARAYTAVEVEDRDQLRTALLKDYEEIVIHFRNLESCKYLLDAIPADRKKAVTGDFLQSDVQALGQSGAERLYAEKLAQGFPLSELSLRFKLYKS